MITNKPIAVICAAFFAVSPAWGETVKLAAFGDSLTAGYGLPAEEGFAPQLQSWLTEHGADVEVLNSGVSGETTAGGLARIEWSLTDDIDAVIVELGANDLLRGLPPEAARENLTGILEAISERDLPVLLAGMPAPANYGADYKVAFDAIYPDLAAEFGAILYPNFLAGIGEAGDLSEVANLMQPDGLHPNKDGVAKVVAHIGPFVLDLVERVSKTE